jgi:hypothetical protein
MDTTHEMLPAEDPGPNTGADGDPPVAVRRRMPRWLRRATWSTGLFLSLLGALLVAASLVSSGYVAYKPGSATPADDRVEVTGGATAYPPAGDILFLTVSVDRMSKLEKWWFDRNDDVDMVKESVAYPKGRDSNTVTNALLRTPDSTIGKLCHGGNLHSFSASIAPAQMVEVRSRSRISCGPDAGVACQCPGDLFFPG